MKKILLLFILSFSFIGIVNADQLIEVTLVKCVDGDTAYFNINGKEKKARFLAVDTPETIHPTKGEESGGKTASEFTCNSLKKAKKIEVEYDPKSSSTDKYERELVWVYIDGKLFQETLIKEGYAEVAYIYGKYQYIDSLCKIQSRSIKNRVGIWNDGTREEGYCKTKSNTKKTTKKVSVYYLVDDGKYLDAFIILLGEYSIIIAFLIMVLLVLIKILKNKKI